MPPENPTIHCHYLGRVPYREALVLQQERRDAIRLEGASDALFLLEHEPVITLGRAASRENVVATDAELERLGIAVEPINRGGDVTYHGPGQLVGYPVLDLTRHGRDTGRPERDPGRPEGDPVRHGGDPGRHGRDPCRHGRDPGRPGMDTARPGRETVRRGGDLGRYVRGLEEAIIRTLAHFGVGGGRVAGRTGVWVDGAKVAAIGIHVDRWITQHGFALNVNTDLGHFDTIIPCGIRDAGVTSLARLLGAPPDLEETARHFARCFGEVFDCPVSWDAGTWPAAEGQLR